MYVTFVILANFVNSAKNEGPQFRSYIEDVGEIGIDFNNRICKI